MKLELAVYLKVSVDEEGFFNIRYAALRNKCHVSNIAQWQYL